MIEIIPTLLTPAMLAMTPLNTEAPIIKYDWNTQTASAFNSEGREMQLKPRQTWRDTMSWKLGQGYTTDDMESD